MVSAAMKRLAKFGSISSTQDLVGGKNYKIKKKNTSRAVPVGTGTAETRNVQGEKRKVFCTTQGKKVRGAAKGARLQQCKGGGRFGK